MSWRNLVCCVSTPVETVTQLDFSHQSLTDVPASVFPSERTLKKLELQANRITELPRALFYCHQLTSLDLSDNQLKVMPPAIASLINLKYLNLSRNGLSDIPDNIKCCKQLAHVNVSVNPLEKLPDGFTQLIALEELLLSETFLEFLPANFGRLSKLRILDLSDNNINTLPRSMARLSCLQELDIGRNEFSDLPEVIGTLLELTDLMVDSNKIRFIPAYFGNLHNLRYFDITNNSIQWIAPEIEDCVQLTCLILSSNSIQVLPEEIGNLKELTFLKVDDNGLASLPASIGKLANLEELVISENSIQQLPPTIGLLRKLKTLMVDENHLYQLPSELCSCVSLRILSVRNNVIESLPSEMGHLTNIRVINLTDNRLRNLPISVLDLRHLAALWLSPNQATPLTTLQQEVDPTSGKMVCTSILFPQSRQPQPASSSSEGEDEQQTLLRSQRPHIRFAESSDLRLPSPLTRAPTPYPKELRSMAKHARILSTRPLPAAPAASASTPVVPVEVKTATVKPTEAKTPKSAKTASNMESVAEARPLLPVDDAQNHAEEPESLPDVTEKLTKATPVTETHFAPEIDEDKNVLLAATALMQMRSNSNSVTKEKSLVRHDINVTYTVLPKANPAETKENAEIRVPLLPSGVPEIFHSKNDTFTVSNQNGSPAEEDFLGDETYLISEPLDASSPLAVIQTPRFTNGPDIEDLNTTYNKGEPMDNTPSVTGTSIDQTDYEIAANENTAEPEDHYLASSRIPAKVPPPYHIAAAYSKQAVFFMMPQEYNVADDAETTLNGSVAEVADQHAFVPASETAKPEAVCRIPLLVPQDEPKVPKHTPSKIPSFSKPETAKPIVEIKPKGTSRMLQPGFRVAAHAKATAAVPIVETPKVEDQEISAPNGASGVASGNLQGSFKSRIPALVATGKVAPAPVAPASPTWVFGAHKNPTVFPVTIVKNPGLGFTIGGGATGNPSDTKLQGIFITKVQPGGPASTLKPGDKILEVDGVDFTKMDHSSAVAILKSTPHIVQMMVSRQK